MTKPFHPSSRQSYVEALKEMAVELNCRGKILGQAPFPKTKLKLGLDQILWIQIMTGDEEGMKLTLELGADPNYRHKGKNALMLAMAFEKHYGDASIQLLQSYGAKKLPSKKISPKNLS